MIGEFKSGFGRFFLNEVVFVMIEEKGMNGEVVVVGLNYIRWFFYYFFFVSEGWVLIYNKKFGLVFCFVSEEVY